MPFESQADYIPRRTRRSLFKAGLGVAGALGLPQRARAEAPELADQLRRELEQKFNIEIRGLGELIATGRFTFPPNAIAGVPLSLDIDRLTLLDQGLSILPHHFYEPDRQGTRLRIVLGKYSTVGRYSFFSEHEHTVELAYTRFVPEDPSRAQQDLTHELTHIITPVTTTLETVRAPEGGTYQSLVSRSPWYAAVEHIMGEPYLSFAPRIWEEVKMRQHYIQDPEKGWVKDPSQAYEESDEPASTATRGEQREIDEFAVDFGYTMRHQTPDEFVAVLAQNYVLGEERFLRMYSLFLDANKAQQLYEFTKQQIFRIPS